MKTRLKETLLGEEANYLLPFIWQRGEAEAVIRTEMERIAAAGIRAVCVEARPHPDFLGPRWWRDMDIIMEEARKRGMRVWMLDDDHFPTGHAAGKLVDAPAALRRLFLEEHHLDTVGPQKNVSFLVKPWLIDFANPETSAGNSLVAVVAARREVESAALTGEFIDLTAAVQGDALYWDIPAGAWRIFFMVSSPSSGTEHFKDYLNPLVPESVKVLLDTIYEAFYARYEDDFGRTFAGFFSDEPGFYNDRLQPYDYQSKLGKQGVALPWRSDLLGLLEAESGFDYRRLLPLLWHESGELTSAVRYAFMNVVSRLYAEHFTRQIGDWCRSHRVEYIGHILEDNGVHTRLGCGAGHYFRALWGQDMAGLDVVLWQLVPGLDEGPFANVSGEADGEFYHYGLGKLGSSLGHIDPKKQGRTMAEVFGAYGWREGLKLMKWMTDHLLVRGVTHFVPHAFSQAEFPDPDCPPHLYARGKNPQYRYYGELNRYTNRLSHLLTGGLHIAPMAVLYHAEAEWSGDYMPFHRPVKALLQNQIDCDVLPGDILCEAATVEGGRLQVAAETYRGLVVPFSEALPARLLDRLAGLAEAGLPLIFVDGLPSRTSEGQPAAQTTGRLASQARVVSLHGLAAAVRRLGFAEIEVEGSQPYLRAYHIRHPGLDVYLFCNEHPLRGVDTRLHLPGGGGALVYDAFSNRLTRLEVRTEKDGLEFPLQLSPYESFVVVTGAGTAGLAAGEPGLLAAGSQAGLIEQPLPGPWSLSTAVSEAYPHFTPWKASTALLDLSQPETLPAFSGTFRYETGFSWAKRGGAAVLDLGEVYETCEVWVNGQRAGVRICPPYCLEIGALLQSGQNRLVVEVTNTLAKEQGDLFSRYAPQEPSGLLGPVRILSK